MSAPVTPISEREAVRRERNAFTRGVGWQYQYADQKRASTANLLNAWSYDDMNAAARKEYPLPKVERPRVARSATSAYRIRDGIIEGQQLIASCCPHDARWHPQLSVPVGDMAIVADLLAHPTELVEDDE